MINIHQLPPHEYWRTQMTRKYVPTNHYMDTCNTLGDLTLGRFVENTLQLIATSPYYSHKDAATLLKHCIDATHVLHPCTSMDGEVYEAIHTLIAPVWQSKGWPPSDDIYSFYK